MEECYMANKKFTEEEMNHLRVSSYVLDISPSIVHFSAEFKEKFWNLILLKKAPHNIVIELGIDPEMLGENRVNGLKSMIKNEVRAGKGFRDLETYGTYVKDFTNPEAKVKYLEQQIAYKDQEIEFLKKIVFLSQEEVDS
jgi:hypothetical protein